MNGNQSTYSQGIGSNCCPGIIRPHTHSHLADDEPDHGAREHMRPKEAAALPHFDVHVHALRPAVRCSGAEIMKGARYKVVETADFPHYSFKRGKNISRSSIGILRFVVWRKDE
jgi:hypothetical protein